MCDTPRTAPDRLDINQNAANLSTRNVSIETLCVEDWLKLFLDSSQNATNLSTRLCCGYCATWQGSLDWFEIDLMCSPLQYTATRNTLQFTATHCNTLQHTAVDLTCSPSFLIQSELCIVYFYYLFRRGASVGSLCVEEWLKYSITHKVSRNLTYACFHKSLIFLVRARFCPRAWPAAPWLIPLWRDSSLCDLTPPCVAWLIYVWHDSFMCDVTHSCVTWLIHVWRDLFVSDMTHSYVT